MRSIAEFGADLSLIDWWPVRAAVLAVTLVVLAVLAYRLRVRAARYALIPIGALLLVVNVLLGVNAYFGYYLTLAQAVGAASEDEGSLAMLNSKTVPRNAGVVIDVQIPPRESGFQARPAQVYLPPVWFTSPRPKLPVIVLLHGTPGSPEDWLNGGEAQRTADRWAATHGGKTPIVVMPDVNGSTFDDTECVNSPRGNAETYLTEDVPNYIRTQFLTRDPGKDWAVAGLSEGGSCAIMLALRHQDLFSTFADFGGLLGPRDGDTNDPGTTVSSLFDGSQGAFNAHEPEWLLTHQRFAGLHGFFVVGSEDPEPRAAVERLAGLARRAGVDTSVVVIPGGEHTFDVWRDGFADALPWIVERVGVKVAR
ncbi:alpha/beta hydrolase-fold protein [Saccharopolyspora sp. WRP15-2]|uniref:Alpha/beta hydrolase-fold protein n=1 Tax=Saccharopolyspora oryzae TaxID=2997343 RepID=A0ABT4V9S6_9PSEU|nr:alpha/beta hydrolase-fold protein [Saccharopolyspora oryzae]MDA3630727.1 alpha/beta hydrolase-fold protein [Saccharopolyspora oryzae]